MAIRNYNFERHGIVKLACVNYINANHRFPSFAELRSFEDTNAIYEHDMIYYNALISDDEIKQMIGKLKIDKIETASKEENWDKEYNKIVKRILKIRDASHCVYISDIIDDIETSSLPNSEKKTLRQELSKELCVYMPFAKYVDDSFFFRLDLLCKKSERSDLGIGECEDLIEIWSELNNHLRQRLGKMKAKRYITSTNQAHFLAVFNKRYKFKSIEQRLKSTIKQKKKQTIQSQPPQPPKPSQSNGTGNTGSAGPTSAGNTPPTLQPPQKRNMEVAAEWDDVTFHNGWLEIRLDGGLLHEECRCNESYNEVKDEIKNRLGNIVVKYDGYGNPSIDNICLDKAIRELSKAYNPDEVYDIDDFWRMPRYEVAVRVNADSISCFLAERKQRYIKKLVDSQLPDYRLVPAKESLAHKSQVSSEEEYAFIFTLRGRMDNTLLLVYENLNQARASIVCEVYKSSYEDCLQVLFNHMADETIKNKRSSIQNGVRLGAQGMKSVKSVNHTEYVGDWFRNLY